MKLLWKYLKMTLVIITQKWFYTSSCGSLSARILKRRWIDYECNACAEWEQPRKGGSGATEILRNLSHSIKFVYKATILTGNIAQENSKIEICERDKPHLGVI